MPSAVWGQSHGCRVKAQAGGVLPLPCVHALHERPTSGLELINLQPQFVDLIRQPPLFGVRQETGVGFALRSSQVWGSPRP